MEDKDKNAFEAWLFDNFKLRELPKTEVRELMYTAWIAAIKHEQNKPIRTYRWDGIIK
jgi:hypothetical protein